MKLRSLPIAAVVVFSLFAAVTLVVAPVQAQAEPCAQVEVQNVRPDQGMLMVAAYADAATFNKAPVAAVQMRAGTATMSFPLCGLSGGSVALMLFQDLNGDGKLDRNAFGIPTEPWGASGKPLPMSAPTWEATSVPLDGTTIVVKLSK
jgi:uncharacterized protein (DUF2141 family)